MILWQTISQPNNMTSPNNMTFINNKMVFQFDWFKLMVKQLNWTELNQPIVWMANTNACFFILFHIIKFLCSIAIAIAMMASITIITIIYMDSIQSIQFNTYIMMYPKCTMQWKTSSWDNIQCEMIYKLHHPCITWLKSTRFSGRNELMEWTSKLKASKLKASKLYHYSITLHHIIESQHHHCHHHLYQHCNENKFSQV